MVDIFDCLYSICWNYNSYLFIKHNHTKKKSLTNKTTIIEEDKKIEDNNSVTTSDDTQTTKEDETANMTLTLIIGNTSVDVFWLDNESIKKFKETC